jgi:site-specific DNA-cytosine methylase
VIALIVVSLFDGISCGQEALTRAGIIVEDYFASEIAQKPMQIALKNYPNTIQIGDITKLTYFDLRRIGEVDLLIGGSPCQDLSIYKAFKYDVKGLEGDKSNLFFHYERILNFLKPKYFLLENVPMEQIWQDVISDALGVQPIVINSNLVSAADRKRLYWTNIPNITQPEDKNILIKDIILPSAEVPEKYWYNHEFTYNGDDKKIQCTLHIKGHRQLTEVYNQNGKCNTLAADGDGGNRVKKVYQDGRVRKFTPVEYERLMNLPDNYTQGKGIADSTRYSAIGNGWTIDVLAHIFRHLQQDSSIPVYRQNYFQDGNLGKINDVPL